MKLYGYFRSSAAYRVRIALNLKKLPYDHQSVHLTRNGMPSKAQPANQVLSTGVTVPVGQTVVLGTSAMDIGQRALILTVRPQLVPVKK